jgi:lipoprotein NlpD
MRHWKTFLIGIAAMIALAACSTRSTRAPVIERLPAKIAAAPALKSSEPTRPPTYTVQKGDTLYSIALEHGHDYKDLANWNNIPAPYSIRIGQILRVEPAQVDTTTPLPSAPPLLAKPLPATSSTLKTEPKAIKQAYSEQALARLEKLREKPEPIAPKIESPKAEPPKATAAAPELVKPDNADEEEKVDWSWPTEGKILANFNDNGNTKGIDISGSFGQPVLASAAGKVVHTGSTLRGYGKLIIIKHNKSYFSVYAHNNQVLVREGQVVVKGQKIAEMGSSDTDRVKLHFEIRRMGTPVDPLKYLPNDRTP